jgi:hypothetical protein
MSEENISNFILDPLSVIIKLAVLSKKEIGSKICVYNNALCIQEAGIFQSLVRFVFKNNKIDIQYLYNPIYYAVIKYGKNETVKPLFINAQKGLDILIDIYKEHLIIVHALIFYKNLINNETIFVKDTISSLYTDQLLNKFNSTWTTDRIKIVLDMIEYINNDNQSDKSIRCLEEFMSLTDEKIRNIMKAEDIKTTSEIKESDLESTKPQKESSEVPPPPIEDKKDLYTTYPSPPEKHYVKNKHNRNNIITVQPTNEF